MHYMSEIVVHPLASGSSGNSILVSYKGVNLLFDAGISSKRTVSRLSSAGFDIKDISAAIISHEHIDHIRGAGVLSRRHGLKIMATEKTMRQMIEQGRVGDIPVYDTFSRTVPFQMGDMEITAIPVPHNAVEPSAFIIRFPDGRRISIATDLGHTPLQLRNMMKGSRMLILESNYDEKMLRNGPYPLPVKEQIMGPTGHLSNCLAAMTLREVVTRETKRVLLAHLSENNNLPELAVKTVSKYINSASPPIDVAKRHEPGDFYRL